MQTSRWEILAAISTSAAVVIALGIALAPTVRQWWRRPRLEVFVGDTEPHCIAVKGAGLSLKMVDEVVLRIEARNVGRSTADGCWAKINRRWRYDLPLNPDDWADSEVKPYRFEGWQLVEQDPVALRWSSLPFAVDRGPSGPHVQIARGASEFAELAVLATTSRKLRVSVDDERAGRNRNEASDAIGTHRWEVVIGSDRVDPIAKVIEFVVDGKNFISDVTVADAPSKAEDHRLLTLLRAIPKDD